MRDYYENVNVSLYISYMMLSVLLQRGCSVQLINPQAFNDNIWALCDRLQELFCCFVGANTYANIVLILESV